MSVYAGSAASLSLRVHLLCRLVVVRICTAHHKTAGQPPGSKRQCGATLRNPSPQRLLPPSPHERRLNVHSSSSGDSDTPRLINDPRAHTQPHQAVDRHKSSQTPSPMETQPDAGQSIKERDAHRNAALWGDPPAPCLRILIHLCATPHRG